MKEQEPQYMLICLSHLTSAFACSGERERESVFPSWMHSFQAENQVFIYPAKSSVDGQG